MHADIFFMFKLERHHLTATGDSAESALRKLERQLPPILGFNAVLHFRPKDGMVFMHDVMREPVPVGVVYQTPYQTPQIASPETYTEQQDNDPRLNHEWRG